MKKILAILLPILLVTQTAYAAGRIQNEDVKSLTDLTAAVLTTTGNISSSSTPTCITSPASTAGLSVGLFVYDTTLPSAIASGTTITGLPGSCSAGQIQMSTSAVSTRTGDTLTFGGQASQLINDTKIWASSVTPPQQLSSAISKGIIGGSAGSKNYLSTYTASTSSSTPNTGNGNFEQAATTGWSLAHSALTSGAPSSTASAGTAFDSSHGGSSASGNLSLTAISSGQIAGNYSGNLASSASSTAGDMMISSAFFIDTEDQAKVMQIKFYYSVNSGAANINLSGTSANSFSIWAYDVTNATWIQPAGVYNLTQSSGTGYATATFQTSSSGIRYQFALINNAASAGAFSLYVDDFSLGPQIAPSGPAVSDWVAYTPTISAGFGTPSGVSFYSRRVGDSLEVNGVFTAGTVAGIVATISIGYNGANANVSIDTSKGINTSIVGESGMSGNASTTFFASAPIIDTSTPTLIKFGAQSSTTGIRGAYVNGNAIVSTGQTFAVHFFVPIAGWSSNSAMSADTDTRVVEMDATSTSTSNITNSNTQITSYTANNDTHSGLSNDTYTIPVSGYYLINANVIYTTQASSARALVSIYKNGSAYYIGQQTPLSASFNVTTSALLITKLNAGDTIKIYANCTTTTALVSGSFWSVHKLSGPAVVSATESVNGLYTDTSAGSIPTTLTAYTYGTKVKDTHNAYSSGTLTIPVSGQYRFSAYLSTASITSAVTNFFLIQILRNGTPIAFDYVYGNGGAASYQGKASVGYPCLAGDTITVKVQNTGGATTATNAAGYNNFSWERVGN